MPRKTAMYTMYADQKDRGLWERDCGPWESGGEVSQGEILHKNVQAQPFWKIFWSFFEELRPFLSWHRFSLCLFYWLQASLQRAQRC